MIDGKRVVAIVPARAGSKRLPNKNKMLLNGKPLIEWTISAAKNSAYIDSVVVSTDCPEIAKISRAAGALIPGLRPANLARDESTTVDVLLHSLEHAPDTYDVCVLLQPTSPLRTSDDIDGALELFVEKQALGVVSVCPCEHSPLWSGMLPVDNSMANFLSPEIAGKRSQQLPSYYRLNGAIYAYGVNELMDSADIEYKEGVYAYVMDTPSSIDIDTQFDFDFAEFTMARNQKTQSCKTSDLKQ